VLTISQLARYVGVSVRTVRHYHQLGLLPEPERDGSGYRRYGADDVIALKRISTLARAGVPLARISGLLQAEPEEFASAIAEVDSELETQVVDLRQRRADLAQLPSAELLCIPAEVAEILAWEREIGLSETSVEIERNSWILLSAAYPSMLEAPLSGRARPRAGGRVDRHRRHHRRSAERDERVHLAGLATALRAGRRAHPRARLPGLLSGS
jgi:DNA-binding transcriptional MerR regulator